MCGNTQLWNKSMLKQQDMTEVAKAVFNEFSNEPVTEKPTDMLRQIINASSKPGDVVADFFMG
ncbi:hypothetical protein D8682_24630 [Buttiauxella sp. 3AFRM03]|nr:hypothetical protein D8682_24630 [Buttiauxella sp. 3AFRM03]